MCDFVYTIDDGKRICTIHATRESAEAYLRRDGFTRLPDQPAYSDSKWHVETCPGMERWVRSERVLDVT